VHAHPRQEEWFFVMEGEVLFQVGERRVTLHAGESILGPRGVAARLFRHWRAARRTC